MSTPRDPRKLKPSPAEMARLAGYRPPRIRSQQQAFEHSEELRLFGCRETGKEPSHAQHR